MPSAESASLVCLGGRASAETCILGRCIDGIKKQQVDLPKQSPVFCIPFKIKTGPAPRYDGPVVEVRDLQRCLGVETRRTSWESDACMPRGRAAGAGR